MSKLPEALKVCIASGGHLRYCDGDGYCGACGYQDPIPADRQRDWKFARWKNQQITHRKKAYEQWKVQREYKRIQRKLRKQVS